MFKIDKYAMILFFKKTNAVCCKKKILINLKPYILAFAAQITIHVPYVLDSEGLLVLHFYLRNILLVSLIS